MRPLIGVPTTPYKAAYAKTALKDVPKDKLDYFWIRSKLNQMIYDSVRRAGGIPIALMPTASSSEISAIASRLDGFAFSGGEDVDPKFYGEEMNGSHSPDVERDDFELELFRCVLETGKPVLGICRGSQLINVALGGSLYQDLESVRPGWGEIHQRYNEKEEHVHSVLVLAPEFFYGVNTGSIGVNSMHHQAVKKLADGLEPLAATEDGLTEAFRLKGHKFLAAVQWHPECLSHKDELQAALFSTLVDSAR